jgi:tetratricopeptide (TPR) repeat protein
MPRSRRSSPFAFRIAAELTPLAPAVAVIALAAASAAAQGAAGLGAATAGAENGLEDVQVGESGAFLRVAIICRDDCRVGARAPGVFFVPGLSESLDIDLKNRSRNARRLVFSPAAGGVEVSLVSGREIVASSIKRCIIDGSDASCIDVEFADAGQRAAAAERAPAAAQRAAETPTRDLREAGATAAPPSAPLLAFVESADKSAARAGAPPPLREAPGEERLIFASLAPPERLAPPAGAALGAPAALNAAATAVAPKSAAPGGEPGVSPAPRLIIDRAKAEALIGGSVDIAREAKAILGRTFDVGACAGAEGRLKADAWALQAMVDLGFCRAIAGRFDEAEGIFTRLLDYTPDNYEALVGRALIAARRGEKAAAQDYFQAALNALPPIAESDRIVAAMSRL